MTSKRVSKAPATNAIIGQIVNTVMERDARGRLLPKVSDAQTDHAIERIAAGDSQKNVTAQLGVARSHLLERAHRDPDFKERLRTAQEMGAYAIVENTLNIASDGDLSSGSIERDKLMCDVAWRWGRPSATAFSAIPIKDVAASDPCASPAVEASVIDAL